MLKKVNYVAINCKQCIRNIVNYIKKCLFWFIHFILFPLIAQIKASFEVAPLKNYKITRTALPSIRICWTVAFSRISNFANPITTDKVRPLPLRDGSSSNQGELRSGVIKKLHDNANRASIHRNLLNSSFQQNFEFCKSDHYWPS